MKKREVFRRIVGLLFGKIYASTISDGHHDIREFTGRSVVNPGYFRMPSKMKAIL